MKKIAIWLAASSLTMSVLAQTSNLEATVAQKLEGTVHVTSQRASADGKLEGCGIEFVEIKRDYSTKRGAPVTMSGSIYFRLNEKVGLVYTLKLGLFDGLSNTTKPVAPANAFISAPQGKAPKQAIRRDSDVPGWALYVGGVDDEVMEAYKAIIEQQKLVVGFNRKAGQQDVTATIDLTVIDSNMVNDKVVREKSDKVVSDFADCMNTLVKSVKRD